MVPSARCPRCLADGPRVLKRHQRLSRKKSNPNPWPRPISKPRHQSITHPDAIPLTHAAKVCPNILATHAPSHTSECTYMRRQTLWFCLRCLAARTASIRIAASSLSSTSTVQPPTPPQLDATRQPRFNQRRARRLSVPPGVEGLPSPRS